MNKAPRKVKSDNKSDNTSKPFSKKRKQDIEKDIDIFEEDELNLVKALSLSLASEVVKVHDSNQNKPVPKASKNLELSPLEVEEMALRLELGQLDNKASEIQTKQKQILKKLQRLGAARRRQFMMKDTPKAAAVPGKEERTLDTVVRIVFPSISGVSTSVISDIVLGPLGPSTQNNPALSSLSDPMSVEEDSTSRRRHCDTALSCPLWRLSQQLPDFDALSESSLLKQISNTVTSSSSSSSSSGSTTILVANDATKSTVNASMSNDVTASHHPDSHGHSDDVPVSSNTLTATTEDKFDIGSINADDVIRLVDNRLTAREPLVESESDVSPTKDEDEDGGWTRSALSQCLSIMDDMDEIEAPKALEEIETKIYCREEGVGVTNSPGQRTEGSGTSRPATAIATAIACSQGLVSLDGTAPSQPTMVHVSSHDADVRDVTLTAVLEIFQKQGMTLRRLEALLSGARGVYRGEGDIGAISSCTQKGNCTSDSMILEARQLCSTALSLADCVCDIFSSAFPLIQNATGDLNLLTNSSLIRQSQNNSSSEERLAADDRAVPIENGILPGKSSERDRLDDVLGRLNDETSDGIVIDKRLSNIVGHGVVCTQLNVSKAEPLIAVSDGSTASMLSDDKSGDKTSHMDVKNADYQYLGHHITGSSPFSVSPDVVYVDIYDDDSIPHCENDKNQHVGEMNYSSLLDEKHSISIDGKEELPSKQDTHALPLAMSEDIVFDFGLDYGSDSDVKEPADQEVDAQNEQNKSSNAGGPPMSALSAVVTVFEPDTLEDNSTMDTLLFPDTTCPSYPLPVEEREHYGVRSSASPDHDSDSVVPLNAAHDEQTISSPNDAVSDTAHNEAIKEETSCCASSLPTIDLSTCTESLAIAPTSASLTQSLRRRVPMSCMSEALHNRRAHADSGDSRSASVFSTNITCHAAFPVPDRRAGAGSNSEPGLAVRPHAVEVVSLISPSPAKRPLCHDEDDELEILSLRKKASVEYAVTSSANQGPSLSSLWSGNVPDALSNPGSQVSEDNDPVVVAIGLSDASHTSRTIARENDLIFTSQDVCVDNHDNEEDDDALESTYLDIWGCDIGCTSTKTSIKSTLLPMQSSSLIQKCDRDMGTVATMSTKKPGVSASQPNRVLKRTTSVMESRPLEQSKKTGNNAVTAKCTIDSAAKSNSGTTTSEVIRKQLPENWLNCDEDPSLVIRGMSAVELTLVCDRFGLKRITNKSQMERVLLDLWRVKHPNVVMITLPPVTKSKVVPKATGAASIESYVTVTTAVNEVAASSQRIYAACPKGMVVENNENENNNNSICSASLLTETTLRSSLCSQGTVALAKQPVKNNPKNSSKNVCITSKAMVGLFEDDDDDFVSTSSDTIPLKQSFSTSDLLEFCHKNKDVYDDVLNFRALDLDVLHKRMKAQGLAVTKLRLRELLDVQSVFVTGIGHRKPKEKKSQSTTLAGK